MARYMSHNQKRRRKGKKVIGSGGKHRRALRGKGPTPKAEDRVYHIAYKRKMEREKREKADPRAAARRRVERLRHENQGEDMVFGRNPVLEALRGTVPAKALYIASHIDKDARITEILSLAQKKGLPILEADRYEIDDLAFGKVHQGVILTTKPFEYTDLGQLVDKAAKRAEFTGRNPLFVALDGVTDPQNVGAVIRSAAAFNATGIILPERRSASITPATWKVSAGQAARMPVTRVTNLNRTIDDLKKQGYYVVGLDGGGSSQVGKTGFESDPLVVVLGSEGSGLNRLTREKCDAIAEIPINPAVESLNASVAAGIALYAVDQARRASALSPVAASSHDDRPATSDETALH